MARVNITIPDELLTRARSHRLNVSRIAAEGLAEELDRRDKVAALDAYLRELDAESGPITEVEEREAAAWVDQFAPERPAAEHPA